MNVAHVVPALFGPGGVVGGAERYALGLARHMAADVPTRLVTFGDQDRETEIDALRVRVLGRPWQVRGQRANPFHPGIFRAIGDADRTPPAAVSKRRRQVPAQRPARVRHRAGRRRLTQPHNNRP
jgi:hypothetical protein